jgi:uncharacterized phage protein (TIGR01671 family)
MSRENKFRVYFENKFWYFTLDEIMERAATYQGDWDLQALRAEKQQFTGLKDKSEIEIYEGDILGYVTETKWIVGFKNGAFILSFENSNVNILYDCEITDRKVVNMKVLGNIYENPELLKSKE